MSRINRTVLIISLAVLLVLAWAVTLSVTASGAEQGVILIPADGHLGDCAPQSMTPTGMTVTEGAPEAPANICVVPGRGQPTIVWDDDPRADWFEVYIGGPEGTALLSWFPREGDNAEVPFGDTVSTKAVCNGVICELQPFVFPPGGRNYDVWMRSWGTPTSDVADGLFSTGGAGEALGAPGWNTADESFSYPSAQSGPLTVTMTPTIGAAGEFTLSWQALPYATWYNVWIGTAPEEYSQRFYGWINVNELGCEFSDTCTLTAGTEVFDTGSPVFDEGPFNLTLDPDEYIYYIQSWGPAGFGNGGEFEGALAPWQSGPEFTVPQEAGTIVEVAVADERFSTLVTALSAAELVDDLSGEGPFTVFAPTNDAFDALPEGTLEALLADIPALTDILLYHVVSGEVLAADVVGLESATTLEGSDISISVEGGSVFLNGDVQVIITNVNASNGVIHVIDAVLIPPS